VENEYLYVLAFVMIFAGFVQGSIGFGFPLVSTAFLTLFTDIQTAIFFTLIPSLLLNIVSIKSEGNFFEAIKKYYPFALFSMIGCTLSTLILLNYETPIFKLLLAFIILVYLFFNQFNVQLSFIPKYPQFSKIFFGTSTGIIGGLTNVMAPLFLIYSLESKHTKAQTIQAGNVCFLFAKFIQVFLFLINDKFVDIEVGFSFFVLFGVTCAFYIGIQLRKRMNINLYKKVINVLLLLISLNILMQNLI